MNNICYLCYESCNTKSQCCNSFIHNDCLKEAKKKWNSNICGYCRQPFDKNYNLKLLIWKIFYRLLLLYLIYNYIGLIYEFILLPILSYSFILRMLFIYVDRALIGQLLQSLINYLLT